MFVALNWPADDAGTPLSKPIGTDEAAPRVWESYETLLDVFGSGGAGHPEECNGVGSPDSQILGKFSKVSSNRPDLADVAFLEATKNPLIDQNLNFVIYDVRMNPIEVSYIRENNLETAAGQQAFTAAAKSVSFPLGYYQDPESAQGGSPGAIEIKSAWRILDTSMGDDPSRYHTKQARIFVSDAESKNGEAFCFSADLGLVGFHALQKTENPHEGGAQQSWNWATFEHIDNAPLATNAGDPSTIIAGPETCEPPADESMVWSFFNPDCVGAGCSPNTPPAPSTDSNYYWESTPPYGRDYANEGGFGTQVVRCWQIYDETEEVNVAFQEALAGTVWANYQLINTQWQSEMDSPPFSKLSIPTYLGNSTLETYLQSNSDCLSCHATAKTTTNDDANFSFVLGLAQ